ncbi:MAG: polysaccharide deacetylase family protein [Candidatus Kapaibacteriota bacterium]
MESLIVGQLRIALLSPREQAMNIFSVNVEDWFHSFNFIEPIKIEQWGNQPSVVENGFYRILELLLKYKTRATFFFLGWVAKKYPHLVKESNENGFEIASHGFFHQEVYKISIEELYNDLVSSKKLLEDISGDPVLGYRAPSFTFTKDTYWFYPTLIRAGYRYDSSLFLAKRRVGGFSTPNFTPFEISYGGCKLLEFTISMAKVLKWPFCFFGGGYLRPFPYFIISTMARQVIKERRPIIVYIHPRELFSLKVKQRMSLMGRFKHNINVKSTPQKLEKILKRFVLTSFKDYILRNYGNILEDPDEDRKKQFRS